MKKGLHIIANLFECSKNEEFLTNKEKLEDAITKMIKKPVLI